MSLKVGLIFLSLTFFLVSCQTAEADLNALSLPTLSAVSRTDQPLNVVATTNIIGDVVNRVGGEVIVLTILMAPGQDPHSYEPSSGDLAVAADADVIFVNGWDLEEGLIANLKNVNEDGLLLPVSAGIEPLPLGKQGLADPHVWLDPHLVGVWVENVRQVLTNLDPANGEQYEQNAADYLAELELLIQYYDEVLAPIPAEKRLLITNHDSFGYFARAYEFEIIGTVLPGAGALAEPSANDLAALVEVMNQAGVCTIFAESTANINLAETVTAELAACESVEVVSLYTGSIGLPGGGADSYIGMMRANVAAIVAGLQ